MKNQSPITVPDTCLFTRTQQITDQFENHESVCWHASVDAIWSLVPRFVQRVQNQSFIGKRLELLKNVKVNISI